MTCLRVEFVEKRMASKWRGLLSGRLEMTDGGWFKFRFKLKREPKGLN
jgi:hypothetical protein